MERARTSSSEIIHSSPACTASAATASPTAISDGHIPAGRCPRRRSKVASPRAICCSASSRWEKWRWGSWMPGDAVRAESTWQIRGRIGW